MNAIASRYHVCAVEKRMPLRSWEVGAAQRIRRKLSWDGEDPCGSGVHEIGGSARKGKPLVAVEFIVVTGPPRSDLIEHHR